MQESELPNAAWIALTDATETLTADGFVQYGDFRCDELIQNTVLWLRLLGQPERGIGAIVAQVQTRIGTCPSRQFVEFSTTFEDGRVLVNPSRRPRRHECSPNSAASRVATPGRFASGLDQLFSDN